jgi:site-specific DNA recombinase
MTRAAATKSLRPTVRCAIYTRKSTEEGLDQDFNSLDAQRESGEAYVASMKAEGWICLPQRYDDGGFTGANTDRPALQQLLADIAAKRVDTVLVYKVDRLSRSLMDFARLMELFDKHGVTFVSVTQAFNTTHSMGRLTLNILLSFAQFEREIISERTRDKIAAARKKGKYIGGRPVLGYDLQSSPTRLVVNEREAEQVRKIFEIYLEKRSIPAALQEVDRRGWTTKQWITKKGKQLGGRPLNRNDLYNLLTNVVYMGKVRHQNTLYEGEHTAIVDAGLFEKVQATLRDNYARGGSQIQNRYGALLKGLLRCAPCGYGMMHTYTVRHRKRYRYYVCLQAQKRGWHTCPSKSVPAAEIERFVVGQVRKLELARLQQAVGRDVADKATFEAFDEAWEGLSADDKARVLRQLVERVDYDGAEERVSVVFRSKGSETKEDQAKEEFA